MYVQQQTATMRTGVRSRLPAVAPFTPASVSRRCVIRAQKEDTQGGTGRRDVLGLLGLFSGLAAANAAQAADPYEELRSISAARTGSQSLLESFEATKGSVSNSKASRGIREKLAAEAANTPAPVSTSKGGFKLSGPKLAAPAPAAPKPAFGFTAPKPAAPKPAAPKPAPAAAAAASSSGGGGFSAAPLLQAAGVLGVVGIGANVATNLATSKPKNKPAAAAPAASPAPQKAAKASGTAKAAKASGTGKVTAAPTRAGTGKVTSKPSSTGKVLAGAAASAARSAARSSTAKVVKKVPAAAAASGSTVKAVVKKALVNEEAPEQPSDFATAGFLGFVAVLAGFLLFGLPKPTVVQPTSSPVQDPLVQQAKEAGVAAVKSSNYVTPLFKAAEQTAPGLEATRKALSAPAPAPAKPAPAAPVAPVVVPPKPAAVEAPKAAPAPAAAPAVAPKPAAPAAPAAVKAVDEQQQEAAAPSGAQNLLLAAGGVAVVVTALAFTGGSSTETTNTEGSSSTTAAPAAAGEAASAASALAESVSATASAASAAAASAPSEGGNAAYDKAVMALMASPEVTDDLFSVMSTDDAPLKNIPALAWTLLSSPATAEKLDGFAFQKLSQQRYGRVRQLLLDAGLQLPDTPKAQPGSAVSIKAAGEASDVDPEKLRGVFEALLSNPSSRTLMRGLLQGAGMPFNEEAFEEQVKDSTYFNLAIAPILRSMPQQKLRVLAELQDPEKLQQLVESVSALAQDDKQLAAVTAELSSDVKQTVNTIREAEKGAAAGSSSSS